MSHHQPQQQQQQQQTQAEIDYERQFQEDLAKATALSLEQQKLDEYQRNKKYGYISSTSGASSSSQTAAIKAASISYGRQQSSESNNSSSAIDAINYYAQLRERYNARTLSNSSAAGGATTSAAYTTRRHSEISNFSTATTNNGAIAATAASSSQQPQQTSTETAAPENDLISFASPRSKEAPELPAARTFEQMIDDLHKLQVTNRSTALVPLGPTAAAPHQPQHPQAYYHAAPPTAMYVPGAAAVAPLGAAGMQLVPFVPPPPPAQQQKVPLTNDELQKLYSMSQQPRMAAAGVHYMPAAAAHVAAASPFMAHSAPSTAGGFIAPRFAAPYGFHYNPSAAAAAVAAPISTPYYPPTSPASAMGTVGGYGSVLSNPTHPASSHSIGSFNNASRIGSNSIQATATAAAAAATAAANTNSMSNGSAAALSQSGSNANVAASTSSILRRQTPPARKSKVLGDDLIDLSHEDDSRVSVLEAFDPLLNDDNSGTRSVKNPKQ